MNCRKEFLVRPGSHLQLKDFDPSFADKREDKKSARSKIKKLQKRMDELQFQLYAEQKRSLLICLRAPDAGGKGGVVRHVIGSMNPQGCRVVSFKQPSAEERGHDFLWRVEYQTPKRGRGRDFQPLALRRCAHRASASFGCEKDLVEALRGDQRLRATPRRGRHAHSEILSAYQQGRATAPFREAAR